MLLLFVPTAGFYVLRPERWTEEGEWLAAIDVGSVAEMVPAIVIAIFVFAVGVAFVIAQVVPPTRGTRAVDSLRGRRLRSSVSPAPALIAGSVILPFAPPFSRDLSVLLLIGSFVYTALSLVYMLSILIDATDPAEFKALLMRSAGESVQQAGEVTAQLPDSDHACGEWRTLPLPREPSTVELRTRIAHWGHPAAIEDSAVRSLQSATDNLYDVVRTLRGWVRVAARSNDSRELQESLEGILELVHMYVTGVLGSAGQLSAIPRIYWRHADEKAHEVYLNPLHRPGELRLPITREAASPQDDEWRPWEPPALVRRLPDHGLPEEVRLLPCTWLANEVGRAVVRAAELALESQTLLDRDTARLLNTLTNAAEMAHARALEERGGKGSEQCAYEWFAGIMIRHLVEVGLGVRHCPADRIDWYVEPCARLVALQREFTSQNDDSQTNRLTVGAAAGALLVAESLVTAKVKATALTSAAEDRRVRWAAEQAEVVRMLRQAAVGLELTASESDEVLRLIKRGQLEPQERVEIYDRDDGHCRELLEELLVGDAAAAKPNDTHGRTQVVAGQTLARVSSDGHQAG
jgi:hypothetical protein